MKIALTEPSRPTFGWAVLSDNIRKVIKKFPTLPDNISLHAVSGPDWQPVVLDAWNRYNIGIGFVENNVQALHFLDSARRYDLIVAGSAWMRDWMVAAGLTNVAHITQGIDADIFRTLPKRPSDGRFVVGCFTKAEYRKGTDILIHAVARLQQKYKNVWLASGMDNIWPHSYLTLNLSPYIRFEQGRTVRESLANTMRANGVDLGRVIFHPAVENRFMPCLYSECDVGVHLSRCEAGEGQVLKEMLCCGLATIATYSTGQVDVLGDYPRELRIYPMKDNLPYRGPNNDVLATWPEPDTEEVFAALEDVYRHGAPDASRISDEVRENTWERYVGELFARIKEVVA